MGDTKNIPVPDARLSINFGKAFEVFVGPDKQPFTVHESLLTTRSTFFKAARSKTWVGDGTSSVDLPEEDPRVFGLYLTSIYLGRVAKRSDGSSLTCREYMELWILADKLGDSKTANLVIDKLGVITTHENVPDAETMAYCYDNTLDGSALRRLCVDSELYNPDTADREKWERYPHQFLCDMGIALMLLRVYASARERSAQEMSTEDPTVLTCNYHQHDSSEGRCSSDKWTPTDYFR